MRQEKREERTLKVDAVRVEGTPMYLRVSLAEAKGEDFSVEVASNAGGGSVLVTYRKENWKDHWVTYVLPARALVEAVLDQECVDGEVEEQDSDPATIAFAIDYLSAVEQDGEYYWQDGSTQRWHCCHGDDLALLGAALQANRTDAYSHWCAETVTDEMPTDWQPRETASR